MAGEPTCRAVSQPVTTPSDRAVIPLSDAVGYCDCDDERTVVYSNASNVIQFPLHRLVGDELTPPPHYRSVNAAAVVGRETREEEGTADTVCGTATQL